MSHFWEAVASFERGGRYVVSLIRRIARGILLHFGGEIYAATGGDWETNSVPTWHIPKTMYPSPGTPQETREYLTSLGFAITEEIGDFYRVIPPPGVRREEKEEGIIEYYQGNTFLFETVRRFIR